MTPALHRLQLRHLHCFLAVARSGNLRRAAEVLAVSQPAVTKTLAELEDIVGVRLFERGRRGAVPTAAARSFLPQAAALVSGLAEAVDALAGRESPRRLALGTLPTLAPSFVPRVVRALALPPSPAMLQVVTGRNRSLLEQLQRGELDVVIGRLAEPEHMVGLSFEHLYAEPLIAAVRPGHPLLRQSAPSRELARHLLVLPLPGTLIRHSADSLLASLGQPPPATRVETLSSPLALQLARDADAVWLTPLGAAEPELEDGRLVVLPLPAAAAAEPVGLLLRTDVALPPEVAGLVAAIRDEAARRRALLGGAPSAVG